MNNSLNNAPSANSQLGAGTDNSPQTTPVGQNISDAAGNLQTVSTPNLFSGTQSVNITKVGDGNFVPFNAANTTTNTTSVTAPKPVNRHYPIIAGASVLIIVIVVIMWLMSRKQTLY